MICVLQLGATYKTIGPLVEATSLAVIRSSFNQRTPDCHSDLQRRRPTIYSVSGVSYFADVSHRPAGEATTKQCSAAKPEHQSRSAGVTRVKPCRETWPCAVSMLGNCLRRWPSIDLAQETRWRQKYRFPVKTCERAGGEPGFCRLTAGWPEAWPPGDNN